MQGYRTSNWWRENLNPGIEIPMYTATLNYILNTILQEMIL